MTLLTCIIRAMRPGLILLPAISALGLAPASAQPLPTDPELLTGKLENGLQYIIREHDEPPGRVTMWLHISSGSLNEDDDQRGVAHYLEHLAFNGTEHFPPGTVIDYFENLGLTFGRHQNAHTGFDHTAYKIDLPKNDSETIDEGLLFLSDVAFGMLLLPEEIEKERQVILEEKRTREGGQQRVVEDVLARLAPESRFGERLPIGTEESIRSVQREQFERYYNRWYVPSNMTLIIVGDRDEEELLEIAERHFARGEWTPRPEDVDAGVRPYSAPRAIVSTDPELVRADIAIYNVDRPGEPTTTVQHLRRDLMRSIGSFAFNRRIRAKLDAGDASFLSGSASAGDFFGAISWGQVSAQSKPEDWRVSLLEISEELQRARLHGFDEIEIADARAELLSSARQAERAGPTVPAPRLVASYNGRVAAGEPIVSRSQTVELLEALLPEISAEDVSREFAETFEVDNVAFVLQIPSWAEDVPSEAELLELGLEAVDVAPTKAEQGERADGFLIAKPEGGEILAISQHPESEVWSAWLDNNVRVHYRFIDTRKDEASIVVTLAGGQIEETALNRGVSDVAAIAWSRPATLGLTSTAIRELLTGYSVSVSGGSGADAMTLFVSGPPDELEYGLELAHLLLTEPRIEEAAFDRWKTGQLQALENAKTSPGSMFGRVFWDVVFPDDEVRGKRLKEEHIRALTRDAGQAWLERIIATAPIEVAIVGDIDRDTALELVRDYIGTLPSRDRISPDLFAELRKMEREPGPRELTMELSTETNQAVALSGFYGVDRDEVDARRRLDMAADVLTSRMIDRLREEMQLTYGISASSNPGITYPGFGLFFAAALTDPKRSDELASTIDEMFEAFALDGPTSEEIETSKKKIANRLEETMRRPDFWSRKLADLTYRGADLDETVSEAEAMQALTGEEVLEEFRTRYTPENKIRVIVRKAVGDDGGAEKGKNGG